MSLFWANVTKEELIEATRLAAAESEDGWVVAGQVADKLLELRPDIEGAKRVIALNRSVAGRLRYIPEIEKFKTIMVNGATKNFYRLIVNEREDQ